MTNSERIIKAQKEDRVLCKTRWHPRCLDQITYLPEHIEIASKRCLELYQQTGKFHMLNVVMDCEEENGKQEFYFYLIVERV